MRIVFHLLATALIGFLAIQQGMAEEAGAGEGTQKGKAAASDVNASGKDLNGIDTRISVQPRRLGRRDVVREGNSNVRLLTSRYPARRLSAHSVSGRVTRDAIGVPVARQEGLEQRNGPHLPAVVPNATNGAISSGAGSGLAKNPGTPGGPPLNALGRPAAFNRGTISGTNHSRPGFGSPPGIGGPAKSTAGISGTGIRPKY